MFRVLEVALRHHAVTGAGRIAAELQILFEQLLRRAADADIGAIAVEYMVAVERNSAGMMPYPSAAATATSPAATASTAGTMTTTTHTFHVHAVAVTLSICRQYRGAVGRVLYA
jgi:hypothetical protein